MTTTNELNYLSSSCGLARHPLVGWVLFMIGSVVFGVLAYNLVVSGPLVQWDIPLANCLHSVALRSSGFVLTMMLAGNYAGNYVIEIIGSILALYYIYKRFWKELLMVAAGIGGGGGIFLILTPIFNRARPQFEVRIWEVVHYQSFPSGHVISTVTCYGLLAYLIVPKISSRFWKATMISVTVLLIAFIGFSRLYTGDHYLTDVLAGYALGIGWAGFVYTSLELLFRKPDETSSLE